MLNSDGSKQSGVNWEVPQIPEADGEEESSTSLKENWNGGNPELVQAELPETSTNMDIENKKKFYRDRK